MSISDPVDVDPYVARLLAMLEEILAILKGGLFRPSRLIDFDTDPSGNPLADGSVISGTYTVWGATFAVVPGANPGPNVSGVDVYARNGQTFVAFTYPAISPPNIVSIQSASDPSFDVLDGSIIASFPFSVAAVSIFTCLEYPGATPTSLPFMQVYSTAAPSSASLLAKVEYPSPVNSANFGTWQSLFYEAPQKNIQSIVFSCSNPGSSTASVRTKALFDSLRYYYS